MDRHSTLPDRKFFVKLIGFLLFWTLFLRLPTLLKAVLDSDWDESLYIIIADQWLAGNIPYIEVWDHKPIGIYTIFASTLFMFGRSIISVRIAAMIFVFATSVILFFLGTELTKTKNGGIIASVLYPVYSLGLGGTASNTELFFIFFNMLGLLWLVKAVLEKQSLKKLFLYIGGAGLAFGITLQIKYIVILEIFFFSLTFIPLKIKNESPLTLWGWIKLSSIFILSLSIPSLIALLYYQFNGYIAEYIYANFTANQSHIEMSTLINALQRFSQSIGKWSSWVNVLLVVLPLGFLISNYFLPERSEIKSENKISYLFAFWLIISLFECWLTFKFYMHYYLVTLPPLCLFASFSLCRIGLKKFTVRQVVAICLVLSFVQISYIMLRSSGWFVSWKRKDQITLAVAYLKENTTSNDYIYVVNDQPIYYFLTETKFPTRYLFPPFIINSHFSKVANVDFKNEIDHIFSLKPSYVLINRSITSERVTEIRNLVEKFYLLENKYDDLDIYGIKTEETDT